MERLSSRACGQGCGSRNDLAQQRLVRRPPPVHNHCIYVVAGAVDLRPLLIGHRQQGEASFRRGADRPRIAPGWPQNELANPERLVEVPG